MKNKIFILLSLCVIIVTVSEATADMIMLKGTIQAINNRTKELSLVSVSVPAWQGMGKSVPGRVLVILLKKCAPLCDDQPLPRCAEVGRVVRVWGTFSQTSTSNASQLTFHATELRGTGRRFSNDATGVRSRIGRGCKTQQMKNKHFHRNWMNKP